MQNRLGVVVKCVSFHRGFEPVPEHVYCSLTSSCIFLQQANITDLGFTINVLALIQALKSLKNGKAPGICNNTVEMLKSSGCTGVTWLTTLFTAAWTSGQLPDDWRKGIILPFYKGKGSQLDCSNYRGITLLSVPGKRFASILLSRVKEQLLQMRRSKADSHQGQS